MKTLLFWGLLSSSSIASVKAEQYSSDFRNANHPSVSGGGHAEKKLDVRVLSSNQPMCSLVGPQFVCVDSFAVGYKTAPITVKFQARCDLNPTYGFDYRKSSNCGCVAQLTSPNNTVKECPCTICQTGFGTVPVSVDCSNIKSGNNQTTSSNTTLASDFPSMTPSMSPTSTGGGNGMNGTNAVVDQSPYVFGTCTSVDCSGACNGTCALNCEGSGSNCEYCASAHPPPTAAPIGTNNGAIKNFASGGNRPSLATTAAATAMTIFAALVF